MRVITEPTVHVLSVPKFFDHPSYIIPKGGTDSERLIAHAGKGCYDSYGLDGRSLSQHIESLISTGHGSVLEHANISIFIEGISRGCSHEIVRHRAGFAYSQRSTRYTAEGDANIVLDPQYVIAFNGIAAGNDVGLEWTALLNTFVMQCRSAFEAYKNQVEWLMEEAPKAMNGVARRKWARGKARQLLPHALETRMTMTGNLRAWRHFLVQRSDRAAEGEIRRLAAAVMYAISPYAPLVFDDMEESAEMVDGYPEYKPLARKV